METLDHVLERIKELKSDFYAEKVIQEEEGEYVNVITYGGYPRHGSFRTEVPVWKVTQERITESDWIRSVPAENLLKIIYEHSPWFRARFKAWTVLPYSIGKLISDELDRLF